MARLRCAFRNICYRRLPRKKTWHIIHGYMGRESLRWVCVCYDGLRVCGCGCKRKCVCENFQPAHTCWLKPPWVKKHPFLPQQSQYPLMFLHNSTWRRAAAPAWKFVNKHSYSEDAPPPFFQRFPSGRLYMWSYHSQLNLTRTSLCGKTILNTFNFGLNSMYSNLGT